MKQNPTTEHNIYRYSPPFYIPIRSLSAPLPLKSTLITDCPIQCLALGGYRLELHPLHQYPGPFLAKITQPYAGFYAVRK